MFVVERNAPRDTMANVPKFQPARAWNRFCIVQSTLKVLSPEKVPVALFFKWYQMQNRAKSVLARTGPPQAVPKSVKSVPQRTSNLRMPRVLPQSLFRSPCHHFLTPNVQHNDVKLDIESKSNDHKNELMEPPLDVDLPKVKHCCKTKRKLKKKLIKRAHQKQRLQQKLLAENIHKPLFHSLLKAMYFCNMMIVYKILRYILLHNFPCTSVDPNDCVQCPRFYCKTKPISMIKNHWHYTHYDRQQQNDHNCTELPYKPHDTPEIPLISYFTKTAIHRMVFGVTLTLDQICDIFGIDSNDYKLMTDFVSNGILKLQEVYHFNLGIKEADGEQIKYTIYYPLSGGGKKRGIGQKRKGAKKIAVTKVETNCNPNEPGAPSDAPSNAQSNASNVAESTPTAAVDSTENVAPSTTTKTIGTPPATSQDNSSGQNVQDESVNGSPKSSNGDIFD